MQRLKKAKTPDLNERITNLIGKAITNKSKFGALLGKEEKELAIRLYMERYNPRKNGFADWDDVISFIEDNTEAFKKTIGDRAHLRTLRKDHATAEWFKGAEALENELAASTNPYALEKKMKLKAGTVIADRLFGGEKYLRDRELLTNLKISRHNAIAVLDSPGSKSEKEIFAIYLKYIENFSNTMNNIDQEYLNNRVKPDDIVNMQKEVEKFKKYLRAKKREEIQREETRRIKLDVGIGGEEPEGAPLVLKTELKTPLVSLGDNPFMNMLPPAAAPAPSAPAPSDHLQPLFTPSVPVPVFFEPSAPEPLVGIGESSSLAAVRASVKKRLEQAQARALELAQAPAPAPEQPPQLNPIASSSSSSGPQLPPQEEAAEEEEDTETILYNTTTQINDIMANLMEKLRQQPLTDQDIIDIKSFAAKLFQTIGFIYNFAMENRDNEARNIFVEAYKTLRSFLTLDMINTLEQKPAMDNFIKNIRKMRKPFPEEPL
jgi:hypothetical protein